MYNNRLDPSCWLYRSASCPGLKEGWQFATFATLYGGKGETNKTLHHIHPLRSLIFTKLHDFFD